MTMRYECYIESLGAVRERIKNTLSRDIEFGSVLGSWTGFDKSGCPVWSLNNDKTKGWGEVDLDSIYLLLHVYKIGEMTVFDEFTNHFFALDFVPGMFGENMPNFARTEYSQMFLDNLKF